MNGDFDLSDIFNIEESAYTPLEEFNLDTSAYTPSEPFDLASAIYTPPENFDLQMADYTPPETSPTPSSPSLTDILGKILSVGAKTTSQILATKYAQPVLKTVPSVQSGMEKYAYYPAKTAQTGLPLTSYLTSTEGKIAGVPVMYILIGLGVLAFFVLSK